MWTFAEATPTAAVVASRDSVAEAGANCPNVQPLVTSLSKLVLVIASGAVPAQTKLYAGPIAWPSQPVCCSAWLDWPVARSTAYSSYHQSWYGATLTFFSPGPKQCRPSPSAALARPKRTAVVLCVEYSCPAMPLAALKIQFCGGCTKSASSWK